jgi:hypothetical protein
MIIGSKVEWVNKNIPKYAKENNIKSNKIYTVSDFTVFGICGKLRACIRLREQKRDFQWFFLDSFNFSTKGKK